MTAKNIFFWLAVAFSLASGACGLLSAMRREESTIGWKAVSSVCCILGAQWLYVAYLANQASIHEIELLSGIAPIVLFIIPATVAVVFSIVVSLFTRGK